MEEKFAKCPLCGDDTVPGYIQSRDGLGWSEKKSLVAALSGTFSDVKLGKAAPARNCPRCKAVYLEYKEDQLWSQPGW